MAGLNRPLPWHNLEPVSSPGGSFFRSLFKPEPVSVPGVPKYLSHRYALGVEYSAKFQFT